MDVNDWVGVAVRGEAGVTTQAISRTHARTQPRLDVIKPSIAGTDSSSE